MREKYPNIDSKTMYKILHHGFETFSRLVNRNYDVMICRDVEGFRMFIGRSFKPTFTWLNHYTRSLGKKLRWIYKNKTKEFDGFYYFALTRKSYEEYKAKCKKKRNKCFEFNNVVLYKCFDECSIRRHGCVAIFRIRKPVFLGYVRFYKQIKTDGAELILEREPLKIRECLYENLQLT